MNIGMRQWELAKLIGISQAELSNYEVGRSPVPSQKRQRIAQVLGCSIQELFPEEEGVQDEL